MHVWQRLMRIGHFFKLENMKTDFLHIEIKICIFAHFSQDLDSLYLYIYLGGYSNHQNYLSYVAMTLFINNQVKAEFNEKINMDLNILLKFAEAKNSFRRLIPSFKFVGLFQLLGIYIYLKLRTAFFFSFTFLKGMST